jgi:hypothetical protein
VKSANAVADAKDSRDKRNTAKKYDAETTAVSKTERIREPVHDASFNYTKV